MTSLYWTIRGEPASLSVALDEAAAVLGPGSIGFLSAPTEHHLVRLHGATPHLPDGPVGLAGVFSARLFSPEAELRWLHTGSGLGEAVLVAEHAAPLPGWSAEPVPVIEVIDSRYALWGRRFEPLPTGEAGWCRAFEGRLGRLDVPLRGPLPPPGVSEHGWPEAYLSLVCREYVTEDDYGNAEVVEERLVAIETATPTRGEVPA